MNMQTSLLASRGWAINPYNRHLIHLPTFIIQIKIIKFIIHSHVEHVNKQTLKNNRPNKKKKL